MFSNIGTLEIIIIASVIFVLFGGKQLPGLANGISEASREFRKGLHSSKEEGDASKKESA